MKKLPVILLSTALCASLFLAPKSQASVFDANIEKEIDEFDHFFKKPETSIQETIHKEHEKLLEEVENFNKTIKAIFDNKETGAGKGDTPVANQVVDEINKFSPILQEQKKTFENIKNKEQVASKYKIDMQETDKFIEISIFLPGFTKEEIATTIEDKTEREAAKKRLIITATKADADKDKEKEEKNEKKEARTLSFQQFSSFKSVNGQEQSIQYKNGQVQVSIDLPKYASVDADYEMEFKDSKLILKFLKLNKKHKKQLSFTK